MSEPMNLNTSICRLAPLMRRRSRRSPGSSTCIRTRSLRRIEEPETNSVAERFHWTLKEQAIYGQIFRNVEGLRVAVEEFFEEYNMSWRLEKLGDQTPTGARNSYELRQAA